MPCIYVACQTQHSECLRMCILFLSKLIAFFLSRHLKKSENITLQWQNVFFCLHTDIETCACTNVHFGLYFVDLFVKFAWECMSSLSQRSPPVAFQGIYLQCAYSIFAALFWKTKQCLISKCQIEMCSTAWIIISGGTVSGSAPNLSLCPNTELQCK